MLEYFTYKKYKKHQAQKGEKGQEKVAKNDTAASTTGPTPASPTIVEPTPQPTPSTTAVVETPLLTEEDERFLEHLTSADRSLVAVNSGDDDEDEGPKPPLPPRINTPEIGWDSDAESFVGKGKGKENVGRTTTTTTEDDKVDKKGKKAAGGSSKAGDFKAATNNLGRRISVLIRRPGANKKPDVKPNDKLAVPGSEADAEKDDLTRVLDEMNLSAQNNKVFSLSAESQELVGKFTLVLKDLVNGVPTAANDLKVLLEDPDGVLAKNFEKLPSSLKKLVTTLPHKMTSTLAPELLAVAAEAQGIRHEDNSKGGMKATAMKMLTPGNLQELITKPSAIVGMLKAIMNALKLRWPAFIGTSVLWSVAVTLLLIVLWYCHKRGREVRLEKEDKDRTEEAGDRIEELPDDPQLPAPKPVAVPATTAIGSGASGSVAANAPAKVETKKSK